MTELQPFLAVRDVDAAVDFYTRAFGAVQVGERLQAPQTAGGTTVRLSLVVDAPDAAAAPAVEDQPYGLRQGRVIDPFGHHWLIGRPL
jgi:PhnB protein